MNDSTSDRVIRFEGAKNMRDLGGLSTVSGARTRYGSVYRS
ncbi:MAG: tyrosine-protein phosphatase, partial [Gammaproteobacteria bacterium]